MTIFPRFRRFPLALLFIVLVACNARTQNPSAPSVSLPSQRVGGGCEGCELMYVDMPARMSATDTSTGWAELGQKLAITGRVYKRDGKTSAPNVVLYYWQTDAKGLYSPRPGMDEKAKPHGHIRGWVKTDAQGKYAIYTLRPAPYPNRDMAAHIHVSIKEPDIRNEYYIDDFVFDDDKLLTSAKRKTLENRGGSGILRVLLLGQLQIAERNIVLGLNIPNYPETVRNVKSVRQSGLEISEDSPSFSPYHAYGPDKGTRACPVCKYGRYHIVLYFVGNRSDRAEMKQWLTFLEQESIRRGKYLKVYLVYGNEQNYSKNVRQQELEQIGKELNLKNIALTFVPSLTDTESEVDLNKINPEAENTLIVCKHRTIVDKFIDLKPSLANFRLISDALERSKGDFFHLPEPPHP
ncbi:MAG: intradiol ring-cleavage dioxygenase [Cytophagales bacterium]|jgi:protocatechuate 3,4-dioxygenase beta subunit|nr:intradiol ring-cleavage dioxygenase [Cytophagales bacterium]